MRLLKIGELAERTGLTVRTLRYYDEIGLLCPNVHSEGGHRLYGEKEIRRLQKIRSLRALNFSLSQIAECLDDPGFSLGRIIQRQLDQISARIQALGRLKGRLETLQEQLNVSAHISNQDLLELLEEMQMIEKYYSEDQREQLKRRAEKIGAERIHQVQEEWKGLFADFRRALDGRQDPAGEQVQKLARKALSLIGEFTGGDAAIEKSLGQMYQNEGLDPVNRQPGFNVSREVWNYMSEAMRVARGK